VRSVFQRSDFDGRPFVIGSMVCEEQGRIDEANELRRTAKRSAAAMQTSLSISSAGTVLRQKTKINFGGEGLSLRELSSVAATLRGTSALEPAPRQRSGGTVRAGAGVGKVQEMLRILTTPQSD